MFEQQLNLAARMASKDRVTDTLEARIATYLRRRSGVTLFEMARDIPGFAGSATWGKGDQNIILWADMSEAAIAALGRLLASEEIVPTPTNWLVYSFDGGVLDMPIADDIETTYTKPHWLPLVFAGKREAV